MVYIFQLRGEKLQEEKTCEDQVHKILQEDSEVGKRKADEQKKREEPAVLKTGLEQVSGSHLGGRLLQRALRGRPRRRVRTVGCCAVCDGICMCAGF